MDLPYFDLLLEGRERGDESADVFARYVHWGLWPHLWRASTTAEAYTEAMERMNERVVAGAQLADGMTVADVGCGFGGTLEHLSHRFPAARLVGLNIDHRQLVNAIDSRAEFVCGNACSLPFATGSCDAVLAVECIFHFPSRFDFLQEVARVLKPGGRLSLSDFVPIRPWLQDSWIGRLLLRSVRKGYGALTGWENGTYAAMARVVGLTIEEDENVTGRTLPTYISLMRLAMRRALGKGDLTMVWPTLLLFAMSATGILRYRIMSFRKA